MARPPAIRSSLAAVAAASALFSPSGCKQRRDDGAELRERTSSPDLKANVRSFVLGKGFKATQNAPTDTICVKSAVANGLSLAGDDTDPRAVSTPWEYTEASSFTHPATDPKPPADDDEPDLPPAPKPLPAFAPPGAGAAPDTLFVRNEFKDYLANAKAGPEIAYSEPLGDAAADGTGLRLDGTPPPTSPFSSENCREDAIKNWRNEIRARLAAPGGAKRKIKASSVNYTRVFTLKQLATSLDISGKAVARALIVEASAQLDRKVTFNFESESFYQVVNARIASDQVESIAEARWNTDDGKEPKQPGKEFYDVCGDEFINRRTFGAKYVQYFLSQRFETSSSTSEKVKATVKVKLGPFSKSKSISKGWEFSSSTRSEAKDEWRYVATPGPVPPVPLTPPCMSMFAETLADLTAVAEPNQGVPVSFESRQYQREKDLNRGFIVGQKQADGGPLADDLLDVLDMMTKHIGAIRDVLREPGQYARLDKAKKALLASRFKDLTGTDFTAALDLDKLKPGGVFADATTRGLQLIDDFEASRIGRPKVEEALDQWKAQIHPEILPDRFAYTYIVQPTAISRDEALRFCERLRVNTFAVDTLAELKADNATRAWRLPTLVEVRQLRHAFGELFGSKLGEDKHRVHLWNAASASTKGLVLTGLDDEKDTPQPEEPIEIDAATGLATTMCIFGPTDASLLQN